MVNRSCTTCGYAWWEPGQWLVSLPMGFPIRPACANHPDSLGRMRTVPLGGPCRNYRPKPAQPQGEFKRIPVGDGLYAYVDAADYDWLSQWTWHLSGGYAARWRNHKRIYMHREVAQPPKGMIVDHANRDRLDNTHVNVRPCTRQENTHNKAKHRGSVSGFKGVGYRKNCRKWFAELKRDGKATWLGLFDDEAEAARAYDRKALEVFGEFAHLNFPEEWPPERRQEVYAQRPQAGRREGKKVGRKERKTAVGRRQQAAGRSPKARAKSKKPHAQTGRRRGRKPATKPKGGPRQPAERQTAAKSLNSRKNPTSRKRTTTKKAPKTRQSNRMKAP